MARAETRSLRPSTSLYRSERKGGSDKGLRGVKPGFGLRPAGSRKTLRPATDNPSGHPRLPPGRTPREQPPEPGPPVLPRARLSRRPSSTTLSLHLEFLRPRVLMLLRGKRKQKGGAFTGLPWLSCAPPCPAPCLTEAHMGFQESLVLTALSKSRRKLFKAGLDSKCIQMKSL